MKKKIVWLLIVCLIFGLTLTGCGKESAVDSNNSISKPGNESTVKASRLDALKQAFKDAGFELGENETLAFSMIYADRGMKFKLNGEPIEIYEYDLSKLSDEAKSTTEKAKNGSIDIAGFNVPVKYKDGLMLMRYDQHKEGKKITEIFLNFK